MGGGRRTAVRIIIVFVFVSALVFLVLAVRHWRPRWSVIQGAVVRRDSDPRKEYPIAAVQVTAHYENSVLSTQSDASGYFRLTFPGTVLPGQEVKLAFLHPNYDPLEVQVTIRFRSELRQLVIAEMSPIDTATGVDLSHAPTVVSNVRVRYTVNSENEENIGSAAKTFVVTNRGNIPCRHQAECSPDGFWKAASGAIQMDAGAGNEFRDARASCIAGPCPFTRIDTRGFMNGGRMISASALDWSSTATFQLQAEVFRTSIVSNVRELYPVVFGRGLNFTIPSNAEGVTLEAELGRVEMVFPLGPDLDLSWAKCAERESARAENSAAFQCELNPGFQF
jgi:hypothetical protein